MTLQIEIEQEEDGRWIVDVPSLPGVLAYGEDLGAALRATRDLTLRVLIDKIEHGEFDPT